MSSAWSTSCRGSLVAGANYSGSRSYNGLTGADVNRLPGGEFHSRPPGPPPVTEAFNSSEPELRRHHLRQQCQSSHLQRDDSSLRGRAGHRGSFQGSYTLSHAKDYPEANTRFDQDDQYGGAEHP